MTRSYADATARFHAGYLKARGHWIWRSGGVPRLRVAGRLMPARRFALMMVGADVPDDRLVVVTCGEERCVLPDHLRVLTKAHAATRRRS